MTQPVPIERRRRLGNPGKRPLPATTATVAPANTAELLALPPAELLDRILTAAAPWLAVTDGVTVALLADLLHEREEVRALVDAGLEPRSNLRDVDDRLLEVVGKLGLTPVDRARIGVAQAETLDTLDRIRARAH